MRKAAGRQPAASSFTFSHNCPEIVQKELLSAGIIIDCQILSVFPTPVLRKNANSSSRFCWYPAIISIRLPFFLQEPLHLQPFCHHRCSRLLHPRLIHRMIQKVCKFRNPQRVLSGMNPAQLLGCNRKFLLFGFMDSQSILFNHILYDF